MESRVEGKMKEMYLGVSQCMVDIAVVCVRRSMKRRSVGIGSAVPSTLVRKCAG